MITSNVTFTVKPAIAYSPIHHLRMSRLPRVLANNVCHNCVVSKYVYLNGSTFCGVEHKFFVQLPCSWLDEVKRFVFKDGRYERLMGFLIEQNQICNQVYVETLRRLVWGGIVNVR